MNKSEFTSQTVMGGLIAEDRRVLLSCFDEETGEVDAESFMEYCLMKLQLQSTLRIQKLNEQISSGIHELGVIGQWPNLTQIFRSLPDCVKDASVNCSFEDETKAWADRQNKWIGLGARQQEAALKFVEEEMQDAKT
jgi:hypothetical protein